MSREKVQANNERKKNYKKYNQQVKVKKFTSYIPVIIVALVLVAFLAFGGYTIYSSYRAEHPSYETVNMEAISNYTSTLQASSPTQQ